MPLGVKEKIFDGLARLGGAYVATDLLSIYYQWRQNRLTIDHNKFSAELASGVESARPTVTNLYERALHSQGLVEAFNSPFVDIMQVGVIGLAMADTFVAPPTPEGLRLDDSIIVEKFIKNETVSAMGTLAAVATPALLTESIQNIKYLIELDHVFTSITELAIVGIGLFKIGQMLYNTVPKVAKKIKEGHDYLVWRGTKKYREKGQTSNPISSGGKTPADLRAEKAASDLDKARKTRDDAGRALRHHHARNKIDDNKNQK